MKLNKKILKNLILNELNAVVSTQDMGMGALDDFETGKFENNSRVIVETLQSLIMMVTKDDTLSDKELKFLKRVLTDNVLVRTNYVISAIDARLAGNRGYKA